MQKYKQYLYKIFCINCKKSFRAYEGSPSYKIAKENKNDFLFVHAYYDQWINGIPGVRQEVSKKSRLHAFTFEISSYNFQKEVTLYSLVIIVIILEIKFYSTFLVTR
mgnify:CR=1 FL=1